MEFHGGRGVAKAKIFKGKYEGKLEIPEGGGRSEPKTILGGGIEYFLQPHIILQLCEKLHCIYTDLAG